VERLRKSWQFQRVYLQGRKVVTPHAVVFHLPRPPEEGAPRFGFVASKRLGGAVKRNRARRILRELARRLEPKLTPTGGWWVFVAKKALLEDRFAEIWNDLEGSLRRAGWIAEE
jgi:ribonuclease P protein component